MEIFSDFDTTAIVKVPWFAPLICWIVGCKYKPKFHHKFCLRWVVNAREQETNNMNAHAQRKPNPCVPNVNFIPQVHVGACIGHYRLALSISSFWIFFFNSFSLNMSLFALMQKLIAILLHKIEEKQKRSCFNSLHSFSYDGARLFPPRFGPYHTPFWPYHTGV